MYKKKVLLFFIFLFIMGTLILPQYAFSAVYVIPVKSQIEPGWLLFFERSLTEAKENKAQAIILDMNTPGGYIDTAIEAKNLISDFTAPVYVFVNDAALSAGAYLALAADQFYMSPASTIGAAEPILLGGGQVNEKTLSFWEAEMRAIAEKQGKDPDIAAAMVRKELIITNMVKGGELLTLTSTEAERLRFSNGTVNSIEELIRVINLQGSEIVYTSANFWEKVSGWLINPVIATLLLMFGFFFLFVEILTAGFGLGGFFSLLFFGLYFGAHLLTGISGWLAIYLFLFGIIFLLTEAFIPGFGIFGIGGLIAVIIGIILAASSTASGMYMLFISFFVATLAGYIAFKSFQKRGILKNFILSQSATREAGYSSSPDYSALNGEKGQTLTSLRPSGIIEIDGKRYDSVSSGEFINSGENIEVIKVEGNKIIVQKNTQERKEN